MRVPGLRAGQRTILAVFLLLVTSSQLSSGSPGKSPLRAASAAQNAKRFALSAVGPNEGEFLILSDIHFDPFSDPDPGVIANLAASPVPKWQSILEGSPNQAPSADGLDTNYPLLAAALRSARDSGAHYDYVIAPGDFLGHNFDKKYRDHNLDPARYEAFVLKTELFVSLMIRQTFPSLPIYAALGNNDSTLTDYAPPGKSLLAALSTDWSVVASHPSARRSFRADGYYAVPHPTVPSQEFIVLNTAYWSSRFPAAPASSGMDPGAAELVWLRAELAGLRRTHRFGTLILHIPVGFDAYASAKAGNCEQPVLFWKASYESAFLQIAADFKDVLRDAYAGHTHTDDFRVLSDSGAPFLQMHIAAAISRDHRNDPGYEIGIYDKSNGALDDYAIVFLSAAAPETGPGASAPLRAEEYDFRQLSGFPAITPGGLQTLNRLVLSSATLRERFLDFLSAHSSASAGVSANWRSYACAETEMSATGYHGCACSSAR